MAYQVGQLRDSDITSTSEYFKDVEVELKYDIELKTAFTDISFMDAGLSSSSSDFLTAGTNYYLDFSVERYEQGYFDDPQDPQIDTLDFTMCLLKINDITGQYEVEQTLDSFTILPYPPGETQLVNKIVNFEVIYTPLRDNCTKIGFILKRKRYDYRGEGEERIIKLTVNSHGIINNILPKVPGIGTLKASKIGVQSKPGFLMCINGEAIRVGKTGVYEINNGVPISFFGIAYINEHYLLDCAWNS